MNDFVKKPNKKTDYTEEQLKELMMCEDDPFYFIERFMKVQHPKKGSLPLILYPFQRRLIEAFHGNNKVVGLTARQMGKCVTGDTHVSVNGEHTEIASLVNMGPKARLVNWLESKLVDLARRT
jgi:hypothetical protein